LGLGFEWGLDKGVLEAGGGGRGALGGGEKF
jgi:hypothetical protein